LHSYSFLWWIRGESSRLRARSWVGSDLPPAGHSLPTRSIPFIYHQIKEAPSKGCFFYLVDPRGIEPLSENLLISLSPGAFCSLNFPLGDVNRQTSLLGSHFLRDRFNGEPSVHGHRSFDAQSRTAILPRGTGGLCRSTALRQPMQRYYR